MSISWQIEQHDVLSSTQDVAIEYARQDVQEGFCVQALSQTHGKGRHGRQWDSQPGNLYLSLVLNPQCSAQVIGQISLLTGVAIAQSISADVPDLTLKWPNDVMIGGLKCAGILLNTDLNDTGNVNWLVVGLGVNVEHALDGIGVALNDCSESDIDLLRCRDKVLERFSELYKQWQSNGFDAIREDWLVLAHPVGTAMSVRINEDVVEGCFEGLDGFGNLILKDLNSNLKTIPSGDVFI